MLSIIRGDEQLCTKIMDVVFNDIKGDMPESDQKGLLHNTENSRLKSNINLSNSSYNLTIVTFDSPNKILKNLYGLLQEPICFPNPCRRSTALVHLLNDKKSYMLQK